MVKISNNHHRIPQTSKSGHHHQEIFNPWNSRWPLAAILEKRVFTRKSFLCLIFMILVSIPIYFAMAKTIKYILRPYLYPLRQYGCQFPIWLPIRGYISPAPHITVYYPPRDPKKPYQPKIYNRVPKTLSKEIQDGRWQPFWKKRF